MAVSGDWGKVRLAARPGRAAVAPRPSSLVGRPGRGSSGPPRWSDKQTAGRRRARRACVGGNLACHVRRDAEEPVRRKAGRVPQDRADAHAKTSVTLWTTTRPRPSAPCGLRPSAMDARVGARGGVRDSALRQPDPPQSWWWSATLPMEWPAFHNGTGLCVPLLFAPTGPKRFPVWLTCARGPLCRTPLQTA